MNWPRKCWLLILIVVIVAIVLRLPQLKQRPMHTDEAVHAAKFGHLLEKDTYTYDPNEYHGPTLNYLTLIPAKLASAHKLTDINEFILRIVPVFFGILLVFMPLMLVKGLGKTAVFFAALLTAVSPAMVFYSRYYIQEMLLVCFTFGLIISGYRYTRSRNVYWALLAGICAGLMYATKETCIIAFASILLAALFTLLMERQQGKTALGYLKVIKPTHCFVAVIAALVVSALFYSSFFTNPSGITDSLQAYANYFGRAANNQWHIHPWYYYLDILTYMEFFEKFTWNEDIIVVMAGAGFIIAMIRKNISPINKPLVTFIAFYTALMTIIYSAIPYKTPWSMLSFLHGMILLAGIGIAVLIKISASRWQKLIFGFILLIGIAMLPVQAYLGSFRHYADPSNPYVYAHTSTDIYPITQRIKEIAQAHPEGKNIYMQVICPEDDYWPLPWYLRSFSNIGYWSKVDDSTPSAPIIIASPSVEKELMRKLYELPPPGQKELYVPLFDSYMELRPQVELRGYIKKNLWDNYQKHKNQPADK